MSGESMKMSAVINAQCLRFTTLAGSSIRSRQLWVSGGLATEGRKETRKAKTNVLRAPPTVADGTQQQYGLQSTTPRLPSRTRAHPPGKPLLRARNHLCPPRIKSQRDDMKQRSTWFTRVKRLHRHGATARTACSRVFFGLTDYDLSAPGYKTIWTL